MLIKKKGEGKKDPRKEASGTVEGMKVIRKDPRKEASGIVEGMKVIRAEGICVTQRQEVDKLE